MKKRRRDCKKCGEPMEGFNLMIDGGAQKRCRNCYNNRMKIIMKKRREASRMEILR